MTVAAPAPALVAAPPGPRARPLAGKRMLLVANTDWNLYNFRLPLARAAREAGMEVSVVSSAGPYVARIEAEGFRHIELGISQAGTRPLPELRTFGQLLRLYRRERPDLVHHVTIKPVLYGSMVARLLGVRAVVNAVSGLGYAFGENAGGERPIQKLAQRLYRLASAGKRTRLIFQNAEDQARLQEAGVVRAERSVLIRGTGVDVQRLHPDAGVTSTEPVVLFASRLLRDKGVFEFVEAARRVRAMGHPARFLIAGRAPAGHPDGVSEDTLSAWRAEGAVEVLGHVDDMPALLASAWMVVLPTTYGEGVPRILLEAGAMGKALVATDATGCREIVRHEQTGLLVPPRDPVALAQALARLLTDSPLRERCGARARRMVVEEFDEKSILAATLDVYRTIL